MTIESVNVHVGSIGTAAAEAATAGNADERTVVSQPPWSREPFCGLQGCAAVDIEAVAREYLGQLREEARAADAVFRIKKKLVQMEGDRVQAAMRRQGSKVRASGIFQGVVAMAAAVATAVSAGVGAAGSAAAQAGSTAAASSGTLAAGLARPAAGAAAKAALLKAGPQLVQATAHLDPFRIQAEKLDAKRQEHQSRKDMESLSLHQTESFIQELDRMKGRVMQIMERAQQLEEESKKTAASAIRA